MGHPLLLLKALHGYTYSGKFLYEEQAEFIINTLGFTKCQSAPALYFKRLPNNGLALLFQYSDDILIAATYPQQCQLYIEKFHKCFDIEHSPHASWYLQAQLSQYANYNIMLDQSCYSKSIIQHYLPNTSTTITKDDMNTYP